MSRFGRMGRAYGRMGGFPSGQGVATLILSSQTIAEDAATGTAIGTLSVANGNGVYTYSITVDADSKFDIDGAVLENDATLDYETATSHSVTIEADNGVDDPTVGEFIIAVTDVDDTAPTITSANSASIAENATLAHTLTANEAVTWTITGGADELQFDITGSTLTWVGDGTQDYETPADDGTNNTYVVQVTATDAATNATNQTITITVTDVSEGGGGTAGEAIGLLLTLTKAA